MCARLSHPFFQISALNGSTTAPGGDQPGTSLHFPLGIRGGSIVPTSSSHPVLEHPSGHTGMRIQVAASGSYDFDTTVDGEQVTITATFSGGGTFTWGRTPLREWAPRSSAAAPNTDRNVVLLAGPWGVARTSRTESTPTSSGFLGAVSQWNFRIPPPWIIFDYPAIVTGNAAEDRDFVTYKTRFSDGRDDVSTRVYRPTQTFATFLESPTVKVKSANSIYPNYYESETSIAAERDWREFPSAAWKTDIGPTEADGTGKLTFTWSWY